VAKLNRDEREELAATRILRVLGTLTVANQRTLEQKIADAGPFDQRINPHILTDVRKRLMTEGAIAAVNAGGAPWFYASNSVADARNARLQELLAVYKPFMKLNFRVGQALEIATYRALSMIPKGDFDGRFKDIDEHDDSTNYSKQEPSQHIGTRSLSGDERLDFILRTADAGALGIECKNVRHWMYPHEADVRDALKKCVALNAVPVLIARRIPYVTFAVLSKCGLIIHQTYNQLMPTSEAELSLKVRDKNLLGYHDVRLGNEPDARLIKFITVNLPKVAPEARQKFEAHLDLLEPFANREMGYEEFTGRVLRRWRGEDEDGPFKQLMQEHNMTMEEVLRHFFGKE
jgi:hypothetical protein